MRHAPAFWWTDRVTTSARLLQPFGAIYGHLTARRMAQPGLSLPVPVVCVGNLVAGGAGKTPTAIALAGILQDRGHRPAFLSRGYGRSLAREARAEVIRVDPARDDAATAGDEPLLLAALAPTYVSSNRPHAARQALAEGATALILDDGLQNPTLAKTLTIAVVDGATGIGNGLCLPAGPLRAPAARQWPFVQAVCIIGDGARGDAVTAMAVRRNLPVIRARLQPDPAAVAALYGRPLFAFAGIGRPDKFFTTLIESGLTLSGTRAFGDHHAFTTGDCAALQAEANARGATLVTTTKDHVRLPAGFPAAALPVTLRLEAPDALTRLLARHVPDPAN